MVERLVSNLFAALFAKGIDCPNIYGGNPTYQENRIVDELRCDIDELSH